MINQHEYEAHAMAEIDTYKIPDVTNPCYLRKTPRSKATRIHPKEPAQNFTPTSYGISRQSGILPVNILSPIRFNTKLLKHH